MPDNPRLFGIVRSNRDYSLKDTWGKNQFNSSFPAALACYLHSKGMKAVYYTTDHNMNKNITKIGIDELYGIDPLGEDIYFSFETQYTPFQKYVTGSIPRNDLVILSDGQCLTSLEVKLVALPDNPTCESSDDLFGAEIVIRPDTIIYLACSFINAFDDNPTQLKDILDGVCDNIDDWTETNSILPHTYGIYNAIKKIVTASYKNQMPIIMEPVWKTKGKSPKLADNCLDVFVWSNCGMLLLFMPDESNFITDCNGTKVLKKIILGGGQNLLSPERRFDAIIYNSPDLF